MPILGNDEFENYGARVMTGAEFENYGAPAGLLSGAAARPLGAMGAIVRETASNVPSSAVKLVTDTLTPILHPIQTGEALGSVGKGLLQKAGVLSGNDATKYADAVGQFFKERYGGSEAIKKTLVTDPVGLLADASMVLTGGAAAAARAPGAVGTVARAAGTVGGAIDPFRAAGAAARGVGYAGSEVLGRLGTFTGGEPIRTAARAGYEGGPAAQAFRENIRGAAPIEDVVTDARSAVMNMKAQRSREYQASMAGLHDPMVLNFRPIDMALTRTNSIKMFKGQDISPKTAAVRKELYDTIDEWKRLPSADYHTTEGFDALKQKIGDIRDSLEYGTPERKIASEVYGSVRQTIIDQAPAYAKTMKAYEQASILIREMEKTLSLNPKASIDTQLRKLQSLMRNNVNTNYGYRLELGKLLQEHGAPHLMEKIAGQALNAWTPRGLGNLTVGIGGAGLASGIGAGALSPWALGVLPLTSPRLVGEAAYAGGRAGRAVSPFMSRPALGAQLLGGRLTNAQP